MKPFTLEAVHSLASVIFNSGEKPKQHKQWKEFISLLTIIPEITRLYFWEEGGDYSYKIATEGREDIEEEKLRRLGHRQHEMLIIKRHPGWRIDDFNRLHNISILEDIAQLAHEIFNRIPNPCFLSGPISPNKQCPSLEENKERFFKTIWKLHQAGHNIFDQTPFVEKINIILEQVNEHKRKPLLDKVLEEVFYPLIKSEKITRHLLMDTWRTSYGARWEAMNSSYHSIPTYELKPDFLSLSVKDAQLYLMELQPFNKIKSSEA